MAYEPTEWKSGDVVTSAKLNKLEQGVANAGGGLVVNATEIEGVLTLDKTYNEIKAVIQQGGMVFLKTSDNEYQKDSYQTILGIQS